MGKPTIKLRQYQQDAVDKALLFLKFGNDKDKPVIIAPTAAGKSIYIAHIAHDLSRGVLVLQPSKELLEQNYAKFKAYGGNASIFSASMGVKEVGHVTFATIGSIKKHAELFAHVKYIIIDECHLVPPQEESMYTLFLSQVDAKVLGLTATPFRLKKYRDPFSNEPYSQINLLPRERPRFFNTFLHITQIKELYDQGFLCPIKYIPLDWENGALKVNTTGAEYTEASVDRAIADQMIYERLPGVIRQSIQKGRKYRIVFVPSVSEAESLARRVPHSACVSAETKPKERERILSDFKACRIKTIFNVGVLTVGFDFPELDTIIIARPTMSLALYMQMIGRGIRIHKDKQDCAVVDMCGNIQRFGEIEKIEFTLDIKGKWIITNGTRVLSGVKIS